LSVYLPELLKAERKAIGGCISEDLGGGCHFKAKLIDICVFVVLEVDEKESKVHKLCSASVILEGKSHRLVLPAIKQEDLIETFLHHYNLPLIFFHLGNHLLSLILLPPLQLTSEFLPIIVNELADDLLVVLV
jgi:hypothetical protein